MCLFPNGPSGIRPSVLPAPSTDPRAPATPSTCHLKPSNFCLSLYPPRPLWRWLSVPPHLTPACVPGRLGEFLLDSGKNNWSERKAFSLPGPRPPPSAWGSLPESAPGPKQETLRFLASPRRPPDLAPAPQANSPNIIPREEPAGGGAGGGRLKEAFRALCGQARGFLSPGAGPRPPLEGPQVAGGGGAGCCPRVPREGGAPPSGSPW